MRGFPIAFVCRDGPSFMPYRPRPRLSVEAKQFNDLVYE